jgi:uncharacterized membrane protein YdfJ with MMPL/SSD domain
MFTSVLHRITDFSSSKRGKFVVIALWLVLAIALKATAPNPATLYDNSSNQRLPSAADSQVANRLLLQKFPSSRGLPAIIVFHDPSGLNVEDRIRIHRVSDWLASDQRPSLVDEALSVFTVPQATSQLLSADGTTMIIILTLKGAAPTAQALATDQVQAITTVRHYLADATAHSSLQANLTGPAGIVADLLNVFSSVDLKLLLVTVGLVFVLLILLYRSPLLALLPLLAVGLANVVITGLLGFGARAGLSVAQMSAAIATVLLFGAGTDYSIFIVSRFREELARVQDKYLAMQQTMRAVGEAITSSAGTVILAMGTLLFAALGLYSSLGPALVITIIVMLLAGLTLVPALVVWFGRAAYWPFVPRSQPEQESSRSARARRGLWERLGQWTVRHRVLAVVGSTIFLGVLALGNIGSQPSLNTLNSFRVAGDSTRGYEILQQHFSAGALAPTTVLIQLRGATSDAYGHLAQLDAVTAALQQLPGIATVQGPTRPDGSAPALDPTTLQATIAALPANVRDAIRTGEPLPACKGSTCPRYSAQFFAAIGAYAASTPYVSPDNTTVQLSVVLKDDPYALGAIDRLPVLRATLTRALVANGLGSATFHLAGQTSELADTLSANQRDTLLIVPAVLVLVFLVLALLLRSLVAPLYLLAAVTLNFLAAIGVCSFLFQRIQGADGFFYAIPLYTFIFLVALGADYTIFLMSRVREVGRRRGLEVGVPFAVARTGGVITSAGLILAGTFLVLTTLPLTLLYQLGIAVAVGILMDTFLVRGLLIPGLVVLLGKWNWWPGRNEMAQEETHERPPRPIPAVASRQP